MKKAGTRNPVFMLDEVDKMASDFRGDPASALLEVLDPEQNRSFQDHYLDVEYDLSQVLFVATANVLHTIPAALQDRMEILRLHGYTEVEKLEIAKQYLVKKQRDNTGLTEKNIAYTDGALAEMIRSYTREAGVRNLEREIGNVCRKVARRVVKSGAKHKETLTPENIAEFLGVPKFRDSMVHEKSEVGLVNGLAWTEVGGSILQTEVQVLDGKGKLTTTGQLGDVMQESAQGRSPISAAARITWVCRAISTATSIFTSMCPKARSRKMDPQPASRWRRRWPVPWPRFPYGATWP